MRCITELRGLRKFLYRFRRKWGDDISNERMRAGDEGVMLQTRVNIAWGVYGYWSR
jgi:hypothetical protein